MLIEEVFVFLVLFGLDVVVMIKVIGGGGGCGMCVVCMSDELCC